MINPKGTLFAIGGAIDNSEDIHDLSKQQKGLLKQVIEKASHQSPGVIEIISAASTIPDDIAAEYILYFKKFGCKEVKYLKIKDKKSGNKKALVERLRTCSCVVFTGGNQNTLVALLEGTEALKVIKHRYLEDNFVITGISAGAAAMGDIMIKGGNAGKAYHKGELHLSKGFGFLPGAIVDTHFDKRGRFGRLVQAALIQPSITGIGVGEDTGLIITHGEDMTAVGSGSVVIVDGTTTSYNNLSHIEDGMAISTGHMIVHVLAVSDNYNLKTRTFKGSYQ